MILQNRPRLLDILPSNTRLFDRNTTSCAHHRGFDAPKDTISKVRANVGVLYFSLAPPSRTRRVSKIEHFLPEPADDSSQDGGQQGRHQRNPSV